MASVDSNPVTSAVTISIVTYNSRKVISDCLARLPRGATVRVFDNASSDDTLAIIRRDHPEVIVTESAQNIGFGRGHNENLARTTTPYSLVLNPDCFLEFGSLERLVEALEADRSAAIAGPELDDTAESNLTVSSEYRDMLSGACLLLRCSAFEKIGYFDPNLFLFYEDTDLCAKAKLAGLKLLYVPQARARHLIGESSPRSTRIRFRRDFHMGWSETYYKCKYRAGRSTLATQFKVVSRHSIKALTRLLRLSPKAIESLSRICGAVSYCLTGPSVNEGRS